MKFFKIREARKQLKEVLHYSKHIRNMHEDIADSSALDLLTKAQGLAQTVRKGTDEKAMETAGEALLKVCEKVAPPRPHPKLRENLEVLFVALGAAMAIRAYIFQPFKIPTGSMQPTLYGITSRPLEPGESSAPLSRIYHFFAKGEVYLQATSPMDQLAKKLIVGREYTLRAQESGFIRMKQTAQGIGLDYRDNFDGGTITIFIGNTPHIVPKNVAHLCRFGESIRAGESLLRGVAKAGDYILVNRMKYNFIRPKRGDITVFDTRELTHPQVRKDAYYIKRMVGLPGETVSVEPPYLLVNGEKPADSRFDKLFTAPNYHGYQFAHMSMPPPLIGKSGDSITVADDEYLFFGDNTDNSLDGRYFGPVNRRQILGSAFLVCLPFDRAGHPETSH